MKTVYFTSYDFGYKCSLPGDQEGEYVKVEAVKGLVEAAERLTASRRGGWSEWTEAWDEFEAALSALKEAP